MLVYVVLFLVRSNVCMNFDTVIVKVQISLEYIVSVKYPGFMWSTAFSFWYSKNTPDKERGVNDININLYVNKKTY